MGVTLGPMKKCDRMKVLVTGASGQLGYDTAEYLKKLGHIVLTPSHSEMDIVQNNTVLEYFKKNKPLAVIHCAAWTAVDLAEEQPDQCRMVNVTGTENIVLGCRMLHIPVLYISTDYVFDGTGTKPWKIDSPTNPLNVYGLSKLEGEQIVKGYPLHYIVRISWVFGSKGNNFIKTMLSLSKKTDVVKVIADQIGSPTYTVDLAPALYKLMLSGKYGVYHAHNIGYCSWYDIAVETFTVAGIKMKVIPISSKEYPTKATRPKNSRMSTICQPGEYFSLPPWKSAVRRFIMQYENDEGPHETN